MAISTEKLLNRPSTELHRRYSARLAMEKSFQKKMISGSTNHIIVSKKELDVVEKKVIKIKDLIKTTTLLKKSEEESKRKETEKKEFSERESKLEKPKEGGKDKIKLPSAPRLSFLERIKKFLFNVLLGYIVVRLLPQAPKLMGIVKVAGKTLDFMTNIGVGLVDGLATFVQKGYEAYDFTKKTLKNFGGDNVVKLFDAFNGAVGKVIEASIIAALAFGELGGGDSGGPGPGGGRRGFDNAGRRTGVDAQRRFAERYGRKEFIKRFGEENLKNLPKSMQRGALQKGARSAFVGVLGKGGAKSVLKVVRPFLKRLPIPVIGALIDFGLSVALGESPGRAAFKAIGAGLAGVIGTAIGSIPPLIPFGGPLIGGILGGWAGDALGSALYDMFFGGKGKSGGKVPKYAGGGTVTRGGKVYSGPRRGVGKTKVMREVKVEPTKLNPGSDVGGQQKVETSLPIEYSEKFYDTTSDIPFFGPIFALATKTYVGDKPKQVDYKNAGSALNSWINTTFNPDTLRGGIAFAEGGEVNSEMLLKGEDLTNIIAKSLENNISKKVDDAINDLRNQMMLGKFEKNPSLEGKDQYDEKGTVLEGTTGGEYGPILDLIASVEAVGGYDVVNGGKISGLSKMTISAARQAAMASGGSGAMGRYQQMPQFVLNRAKSIGLNPETDLFNAENQDKLAILLIDGAGYKKWKSGRMSTEQFAHNLSATWRGLPEGPNNKTYQDRYASGNKAHTTWANVIATLNSAKSGTIAGGQSGGGILGSGKVGAVDQFTPLAKKFGLQLTSDYRPGDRGYHGRNRARDYSNDSVGSGTPQQLKFAQHLAKNYGSSLTQLIYTPLGFGIANGKKVGLDYWGAATNAQHYHHVHVALDEGGLVDGVTYAMIGERGPEFVLDSDTTMALEQNFPGFLNALNKANYDGALQVLRNYAEYEFGSAQEIVVEQPEPEIVYVPMPTSKQEVFASGGSSYRDPSYDNSYMMG